MKQVTEKVAPEICSGLREIFFINSRLIRIFRILRIFLFGGAPASFSSDEDVPTVVSFGFTEGTVSVLVLPYFNPFTNAHSKQVFETDDLPKDESPIKVPEDNRRNHPNRVSYRKGRGKICRYIKR
jgi:hypothetical protein